MQRKKKILIIDDDIGIHVATKHILREFYDCFSAYKSEEAKAILNNQTIDVVLLDLNIQREEEGLELLPHLKNLDQDLDVIVISSNIKRDIATKAIQLGASSYLVKDHSPEQLLITIDSILAHRELLHEKEHHVSARKRVLQKNPIIGKSKTIQKLLEIIEKVKRTQANVLIYGETGTGKELVARHLGAIDGKPCVAVDSATITSTMAESLLFGHEKGAFTGALQQSKGLFEEANGGTIYFDEIGNMPLEIQTKLLRAIQEKEITKLGSSKIIPLEFRVICATNRDLEDMAKKGEFKYDLLQRINVIPIRIPTLRERKEDIPELAQYFLNIHHHELAPHCFSEEALKILTDYSWPGNVREFSNIIAYLCTMVAERDAIEVEDLPSHIVEEYRKIKSIETKVDFVVQPSEDIIDKVILEIENNNVDFYSQIQAIEGQVLKALYKKYEGNISQLSKSIKVSRSHLYAKLHAHGIH